MTQQKYTTKPRKDNAKPGSNSARDETISMQDIIEAGEKIVDAAHETADKSGIFAEADVETVAFKMELQTIGNFEMRRARNKVLRLLEKEKQYLEEVRK